MALKKITAYAFERKCGIANGYLSKQLKSKGAVGSDILEKIYQRCLDISLVWLVTGEGPMLRAPVRDGEAPSVDHLMMEERVSWSSSKNEIRLLQKQVAVLEKSNADKDKIIALLEDALQKTVTGR